MTIVFAHSIYSVYKNGVMTPLTRNAFILKVNQPASTIMKEFLFREKKFQSVGIVLNAAKVTVAIKFRDNM